MAEVRGTDAPTRTFRPRTQLLTQLGIGTAVLTVPVFLVLYFIAAPAGNWGLVLALQLVVMAVIAVVTVSTRNVYVELHDWGVEDHWPFGFTRRVQAADVDTILLVDFYVGSAMETVPQLFAVDGNDRLVMRMRGQIWSRTALQQVAARLAAPVVHAPVPMTLSDFSRIEPQLLSWFERRPFWAKRVARLAPRAESDSST